VVYYTFAQVIKETKTTKEDVMSEQTRKEAIFSKMIKAKGRTYFLDVKEASNGNKYLTICESRKVDGEWQRNRIMVFESDIPNFFQALKEAAPSLKE
jgi:hypothetical protein